MGDVVAVYADGGLLKVNPSPIGGMYAACHVDADGERVWSASGLILADPSNPLFAVVGNNQCEFRALLAGLEALPDGWIGNVYTDSALTIHRFTDPERAGMAGIPVDWRRRLGQTLARLGGLFFTLLDGHPTRAQLAAGRGKRGNPVSVHQVWCDELCTKIGREYLGVETRPKQAKKGAAA